MTLFHPALVNVDLKQKIILALPKKGRLYNPVLKHIELAGFKLIRRDRSDLALCENFKDLVVFFLPARDIANFVGQGEVDLGITGDDIILESNIEYQELQKFSFGKCRLCLQAPRGRYSDIKDLAGKKIASSFPNLAKKFFNEIKLNPEPEIRLMSGSVEVACQLGFADAVVDLVDTGETMLKAGLVELTEILVSHPKLILNPKSNKQALANIIAKRLNGVELAEQYVMLEYNIRKENRKLGEKLTPGFQSPTVNQLEDENWVAIKAMVLKSEAHDLIDKLENIGATAILAYSLNYCRV